ncbi:MAG: metal ABC transporter substrate-binding protein [Candidatus Caldarchaeum sp.]
MQRRIVVLSIVVVIAAALLITGAVLIQPIQTSAGNRVAVTWGLIGEIVHRLTNGEIEIYQILPPSVELHDWEPTPDVMEKTRGAVALFWTVEGLDEWGAKIAQSIGIRAFKVTLGIKFIEAHHEHNHDHHHGVDVHFWQDPKNVAKMTENIASFLVQLFPEKKDLIERNKTNFLRELQMLDEEFSKALSPHKGKVMITQHDAFRYLGKAYGLEVFAVLTHEEEEPSAAHIKELYEIIETQRVKTIFAEDDRVHPVVAGIARDKNLKINMLYTGEGLTFDGYLKGQGYIEMMRRNLEALVDALA